MSISQKEFSPEITRLMEDVQKHVFMPDKRVFSMLKKLEGLNRETNDPDLYAYIYYSYARGYSFREQHEEFVKYLKKALYYLLRTDNRDYLAGAYNLFGVEAIKNGCQDIAYAYYTLAASYVEQNQDSLSKAVILTNLSTILQQVGEYKKAIQFTDRSIRIVQKYKNEPGYVFNYIIFLLNKAYTLLAMGDREGLRETIQKAQSIDEEQAFDLFHLILRCRLALMDGDLPKTEELTRQITRDIIPGELFSEVAIDLKNLCQALMDQGEYALAEPMIREVEKNKDRLFDYEASLFTQAKIRYFSHVGDEKALAACYEERFVFSEKLEAIRKKLNLESIAFMNLLEDLRLEKQEASLRNIQLQKNAETDALTGLPNRYALNMELEKAFGDALEKAIPIGIGMADIDCFKLYNDTHGHQQGDSCLKRVGLLLKEVSKKYGIFVSRYGGDEFTLIYRNMDEALIRRIGKEISRCGDVTITHGFYLAVPDENSRIWDYLNRADNALYDLKKQRG